MRCENCGKSLTRATANLWWSAKPSGKRCEAYNPFVTCSGVPECSDYAVHRAGYSSAVHACDVTLNVLNMEGQAERILTTYDWHDPSEVRRYIKSTRAAEARASDSWSDEDPIGVKRQRLVKWLMRKRVPLDKARLIAARKYP